MPLPDMTSIRRPRGRPRKIIAADQDPFAPRWSKFDGIIDQALTCLSIWIRDRTLQKLELDGINKLGAAALALQRFLDASKQLQELLAHDRSGNQNLADDAFAERIREYVADVREKFGSPVHDPIDERTLPQ